MTPAQHLAAATAAIKLHLALAAADHLESIQSSAPEAGQVKPLGKLALEQAQTDADLSVRNFSIWRMNESFRKEDRNARVTADSDQIVITGNISARSQKIKVSAFRQSGVSFDLCKAGFRKLRFVSTDQTYPLNCETKR
jgi:hypothetical protein